MKRVIIITVFVWIGFICAISFMESWLKFQAQNITTKLGLGIGKLVFEALNKVEIFFTLTIIICLLLCRIKKDNLKIPYLFIGVLLIVIIQTIWLLPALGIRAELIINNIQVPKSNLHLIFVILEICKVTFLLFFGQKQLKKAMKN